MMSLQKTFHLICLAGTVLCLFIGFGLARQWTAFGFTLIPILAWICGNKWPFAWLPVAALVVSIGLAAGGLILGASPFLMLAAATLALANWDLALFKLDQAGNAPLKTISLLERKHIQSLAWVIGLSLLVLAGRLIHFRIPFVGMVLLVGLAFFSLVGAWQNLGRKAVN